MTKEEYHIYRQSKQWLKLKREVHKKYGGKCKKCKTTWNLDVHHKTYENIGREKLSDLVLLCRKHHYREHPKKWFLSLRPSSLLDPLFNWLW